MIIHAPFLMAVIDVVEVDTIRSWQLMGKSEASSQASPSFKMTSHA